MTVGHRAIILSFSLLLLTGSIAQPCLSDELTVYTWFDYFPASIIKQFEDKSGHTVKFVYFSSDMERDAELYDSGVEFDVVITDAFSLSRFSSLDLFEPIKPSMFGNYEHLAPQWRDSCGDLGVPFFWGGVGIAYRSTQVTEPVDSWEDILFPEAGLDGRISMLNESFDLLIPPLKLAGASANSDDIAELERAYELLLDQRPHVWRYSAAFDIVQSLPAGEGLAMAQVYSGNHLTYREVTGQQDWEFVYPKEGTIIWMDCLSIESSGMHRSLALEFIDFLLDPIVAAQHAEKIRIATPNLSAQKFLDAEFLDDPTVYIPASILEKSERQKPRSAKIQSIRNKILIALEK